MLTTNKLYNITIIMAGILNRSASISISRSLMSSGAFISLQTNKTIQVRFNRLRRINCNCFSTNNIDPLPNDSITENHPSVIHRYQGPTVLDKIEDAVTNCLSHHQKKTPSLSSIPMNAHINILQYPPEDRESIGVASNLSRSLSSFAKSGVHCRRCWLQKAHCVCGTCVELEDGIPCVERLFILVRRCSFEDSISKNFDSCLFHCKSRPITKKFV